MPQRDGERKRSLADAIREGGEDVVRVANLHLVQRVAFRAVPSDALNASPLSLSPALIARVEREGVGLVAHGTFLRTATHVREESKNDGLSKNPQP